MKNPKKTVAKRKKNLQTRVDELPWDVVQDDVEQLKGNYEILSKNVLVGLAQTQIDPSMENSNSISGDAAARLIGFRKYIELIFPVKEEAIEVFSNYIDKNKIEKEDIWISREVNLTNVSGLSDVMVGIWDSGVDVEVFKDQIYINTEDKKNIFIT